MKRLRWSRRATRDLLEIGDYIAADDPRAARRWVERLRARAALATSNPLGGRIVPELGRRDIREVFMKTYRIVYLVQPREIVVLTIFEGHRGFPPELDEDE